MAAQIAFVEKRWETFFLSFSRESSFSSLTGKMVVHSKLGGSNELMAAYQGGDLTHQPRVRYSTGKLFNYCQYYG